MDKRIFCNNCGWSWLESETEEHDKYICHKCGSDTAKHHKLVMKEFIRTKVRESLITETVNSFRVNDIEDDDLYDNVLRQVDSLGKSGEIGFGSAEPFGVILDNNKVAGATWLESSGNFTFHIIINPEYRGRGLSKLLLDDLMKKYNEKKSYMGDDYKVVVNVVNEKLAKTLAKHYGFKRLEDNGTGGVIMGN